MCDMELTRFFVVKIFPLQSDKEIRDCLSEGGPNVTVCVENLIYPFADDPVESSRNVWGKTNPFQRQ